MSLEVADQPSAPTARGQRRREAIVDAATALFARQGYHPTGIDEIGEAAGITGPGIYRHFPSKEDLLIAALDRIWEALRAALEEAPTLEPSDAFDLLATVHARLGIERPDAVIVLLRELRHAPAWYRRAAARNEASYLDAWAEVIGEVRGAPTAEARVAARVVTTAIWSSAAELAERGIEDTRYLELLVAMARESLGALPLAPSHPRRR